MIVFPFDPPAGGSGGGGGGGGGGSGGGSGVGIPSGATIQNLTGSITIDPSLGNLYNFWTNTSAGFTWYCYGLSLSFDSPSNNTCQIVANAVAVFSFFATNIPVQPDDVFFTVNNGYNLGLTVSNLIGPFTALYNFSGYLM
jgi:hypothetical protein